jgi:hypothetical protein
MLLDEKGLLSRQDQGLFANPLFQRSQRDGAFEGDVL